MSAGFSYATILDPPPASSFLIVFYVKRIHVFKFDVNSEPTLGTGLRFHFSWVNVFHLCLGGWKNFLFPFSYIIFISWIDIVWEYLHCIDFLLYPGNSKKGFIFSCAQILWCGLNIQVPWKLLISIFIFKCYLYPLAVREHLIKVCWKNKFFQ